MNYFEERLEKLTRVIHRMKEAQVNPCDIEPLEDERDHLLLMLIRD